MWKEKGTDASSERLKSGVPCDLECAEVMVSRWKSQSGSVIKYIIVEHVCNY